MSAATKKPIPFDPIQKPDLLSVYNEICICSGFREQASTIHKKKRVLSLEMLNITIHFIVYRMERLEPLLKIRSFLIHSSSILTALYHIYFTFNNLSFMNKFPVIRSAMRESGNRSFCAVGREVSERCLSNLVKHMVSLDNRF